MTHRSERSTPRGRSATPRRRSVVPLVDGDLTTRRLNVAPRDVVYVKGIFEASEGVGALFAERGGEIVLACPRDRSAELDELLGDLVREIGAILEGSPEATLDG